MRNIRDKLVARRRRNEDGILQQLDRLSRRAKKEPDQALLDKQIAIENEIASLEKLDELQCEEYGCHSDMINQRSLELTTSSSEDMTIIRSESNNESSADSVEICPIDVVDTDSEKDDSDDDDDEEDVNIVAQVNTSTINNNGCIECNIPSNHSC